MFKLKSVLMVLLVVALIVSSAPAFAQQRHSLRVTVVTADTDSALAAGTWVYGIGAYASSANGIMGIYDYATIFDAPDANVRGEVGHATAGMTATIFFEKPIYFTYGVSANVTGAVGFIYYGPEP